MVNEDNPKKVEEKLGDDKVQVIDIREKHEVEEASDKLIPNSVHIPFSVIHKKVEEINYDNEEIYLICRHGNSSVQACRILNSYEKSEDTYISSIKGGYLEWDGPLEKMD